MVLGFKKQFVKKIKDGSKIHTIREDKHDRWKEGNTIHFATGVRTKKYKQFIGGQCISTQNIEIKHLPTGISIKIDGKELGGFYELHKLAVNDGFDGIDSFYKWFNKDFSGKIIHWTALKY